MAFNCLNCFRGDIVVGVAALKRFDLAFGLRDIRGRAATIAGKSGGANCRSDRHAKPVGVAKPSERHKGGGFRKHNSVGIGIKGATASGGGAVELRKQAAVTGPWTKTSAGDHGVCFAVFQGIHS